MSTTYFSSEPIRRDYALEDLKDHLERVRNGERVKFYLYKVGGTGQVYDEEKISIMREFVSLGGKIDPRQWVSKYPGVTALHIANCHGNQKMINFLIEIGGDVEAVDYKGRKPRDCWIDASAFTPAKDEINYVM